MSTNPADTLGEIVTRHPAAARVFERISLDYCCRGHFTLAESSAAAGIDVSAIVAELDALERTGEESWATLEPTALAEHIVEAHHVYLREELPLLAALAQKVERVHGAHHPELSQVRALVDELRSDLEPHLDKEERVLFPAVRAFIEHGRREFPFGALSNPIRVMLLEHDGAGELLEALRRASSDYALPHDACASYRSLYQRLSALEHDTHVHIHKENNVLFPAVLRAWDTAVNEQRSEEVTR